MRLFLLAGLLLLAACSGEKTAVSPADEPANGRVHGRPDGRLVFIEIAGGDQFLSTFDLTDEAVSRLFTVPDNGWLAHADVSPDGSRVVMAYAPPPPAGQIQFGYTHLYQMPLQAGAEPALLHPPQLPQEVFINPVWTPDGAALLYTHVRPDSADETRYLTTLMRLEWDSGETTAVLPNAIWPRLSPDGSMIAAVTFDPQTRTNALAVIDVETAEPRTIVPEHLFQFVDVPVFSPDGRWIYFSAVQPRQSRLPWWQRLLGVKTAAAHDVPSDWYRIPAIGGSVQPLTAANLVGMYGLFAPDGKTFYFVANNGLYSMNSDGTAVTRILETAAAPALGWAP